MTKFQGQLSPEHVNISLHGYSFQGIYNGMTSACISCSSLSINPNKTQADTIVPRKPALLPTLTVWFISLGD